MLRILSSRLILMLFVAAFSLPVVAMAQSQDDQSVADAARRAREQKKNATKPTKVVTEDDIPARIATPDNAVTPAAAPPANGSATAPAPADQPNATAGKDAAKASDDAETTTIKEQVAQAQKEVDLAKRDLSLFQDTYYTNPDYAHDSAGKAKLDAMRQDLTEKTQTLDQLKTQLAAHRPSAPGAGPAAAAPPAPPTPQP